MNSTNSLMFFSTPLSVVFSVLVVIGTAAASIVAWRRNRYSRKVGLLELLRLVIVTAMAILFNQPEWVEEYRPTDKPTIAVLWDDSLSMGTEDVLPAGTAGAPISRRQQVEPLTQAGFWEELGDQYDVVVSPFAREAAEEAAPGWATDLHAPLLDATDLQGQLAGVVLISDGDWNDGSPPVEAATAYRLRGTPVFTIASGSPTRLPDVELLSVDAPTFGVAGKRVRVPITVESSLPQDYLATVELKVSDGETISKQVRISAMSRSTDALTWEPAAVGDYKLEVSIPQHGDERITDNNRVSAPISIREEKLRVLVVESYPRWEYRYLRNALSRDPGVEVSCLLFHPGLDKRGGGNTDYIKEFPVGLDELAEYDVVFLGDVGCDGDQLTTEQCRLIKGLVEQQASGLVLMPGWQGRQITLLDTEIADLYPVQLDASQPEGWGSQTPDHFQLTEAGRRSLLTKLADTRDENAQVWQNLPGFQWHAPVLRAAAGSEVLCVHDSAANQYGRLPLLVTRTFGAGKVLFMGSDGAWRWRKGVEDKYHYRFWGQVVRWMAYQRNMARGERMRLYYSPDQPQVNGSLTLNANVMDAVGEPLSGGEVTARIVAPSGNAKTVRFRSLGEEWGAYSASFTTSEPGEHQVTLAAKQTADVLETSFFVQGSAKEKVGKPARIEVLEEIARVSLGQTVEVDKARDVIRQLATLPEPPAEVRRLQIWSHPGVAGVTVTLLGVLWLLRKAVGLI